MSLYYSRKWSWTWLSSRFRAKPISDVPLVRLKSPKATRSRPRYFPQHRLTGRWNFCVPSNTGFDVRVAFQFCVFHELVSYAPRADEASVGVAAVRVSEPFHRIFQWSPSQNVMSWVWLDIVVFVHNTLHIQVAVVGRVKARHFETENFDQKNNRKSDFEIDANWDDGAEIPKRQRFDICTMSLQSRHAIINLIGSSSRKVVAPSRTASLLFLVFQKLDCFLNDLA